MFVRGGFVDPGSVLNFAGYGGIYWSSVGYYSNNAYYLDFSPSGVYPSLNGDRYDGFSVRCVALGG